MHQILQGNFWGTISFFIFCEGWAKRHPFIIAHRNTAFLKSLTTWSWLILPVYSWWYLICSSSCSPTKDYILNTFDRLLYSWTSGMVFRLLMLWSPGWSASVTWLVPRRLERHTTAISLGEQSEVGRCFFGQAGWRFIGFVSSCSCLLFVASLLVWLWVMLL
jgi:hypothetical protein